MDHMHVHLDISSIKKPKSIPHAHKPKSVSEYLGRIDQSGGFHAKKRMKPENISQPEQAAAQPMEFDDKDIKILKCITQNARMTRPMMGEITGISARSADTRLRRIEHRYGIKYRCKYDHTKLGYSSYLLLTRSDKEPPPREEMIRALSDNPRVQFAAVTKGRYSIIMYLLAENTEVIDKLIRAIRKSEPFINFPSRWYVTPTSLSYSSMPLRDIFFDLIKERVWRRSRKLPRREHGMFLTSEYAVMRELNTDASQPFSSIDKKYGLKQGNARHSYERLLEGGFLRPTASLANISVKYNGVIIMRIINQKGFLDRRNLILRHVCDDEKMVPNRFSYIADLYTPDGIIFIMPVFRGGELESEATRLQNMAGESTTESIVITDVLIGELNYSKIDRQYTEQYDALVKRKEEEPSEKINYF
jgi:DNA-binding Lrp family transcriptional regulator